jgi:hypothetical protein
VPAASHINTSALRAATPAADATVDGGPEAAQIAAALALLGVALAGLALIDRVRRDAGMA